MRSFRSVSVSLALLRLSNLWEVSECATCRGLANGFPGWVLVDFDGSRNRNQAKDFCRDNYGTDLASVNSQEEMDQYIALKQWCGLNSGSTWIGAVMTESNCDSPIAWDDGTVWSGYEPWRSGQPDACLIEEYIVIHNSDNKWGNRLYTTLAYMALCNDVTDSPTETPTGVPTKNPSSTPTQFPSAQPSQFPSNMPSEQPTFAPTFAPTQAPFTNTTTPSPIILGDSREDGDEDGDDDDDSDNKRNRSAKIGGMGVEMFVTILVSVCIATLLFVLLAYLWSIRHRCCKRDDSLDGMNGGVKSAQIGEVDRIEGQAVGEVDVFANTDDPQIPDSDDSVIPLPFEEGAVTIGGDANENEMLGQMQFGKPESHRRLGDVVARATGTPAGLPGRMSEASSIVSISVMGGGSSRGPPPRSSSKAAQKGGPALQSVRSHSEFIDDDELEDMYDDQQQRDQDDPTFGSSKGSSKIEPTRYGASVVLGKDQSPRDLP